MRSYLCTYTYTSSSSAKDAVGMRRKIHLPLWILVISGSPKTFPQQGKCLCYQFLLSLGEDWGFPLKHHSIIYSPKIGMYSVSLESKSYMFFIRIPHLYIIVATCILLRQKWKIIDFWLRNLKRCVIVFCLSWMRKNNKNKINLFLF